MAKNIEIEIENQCEQMWLAREYELAEKAEKVENDISPELLEKGKVVDTRRKNALKRTPFPPKPKKKNEESRKGPRSSRQFPETEE